MYMEVPLTDIVSNPWQTRRGQPPDYIQSLALDIAANGLLQTPVGRLMLGDEIAPVDEITAAQLTGEIPDDCQVQLAFGHNRLSAYKWLQNLGPFSDIGGDWSSMPVELKPLTDEQMASFAWSENEKRRELSPVERAQAIARRIQDFGWSHEDAAENLGISRPSISNALRLLKLPETIQDHLHAGEISERQAMALLKLFEQPEDLVEDDTFQRTADYLVRQALEGESSESLRLIVDSTVDAWKRQSQPSMNVEPEPETVQTAPLDLPMPRVNPLQPIGADTPAPVYSPPGQQKLQETPAKPAIGWMSLMEPAEDKDTPPEPYQPAGPYQRSEPEPQEPLSPRERSGEEEQPQEAPQNMTWAQSIVTLTIKYLPYDGNVTGRRVVVTADCNDKFHAIRFYRSVDFTLPQQLTDMMDKLRQESETE